MMCGGCPTFCRSVRLALRLGAVENVVIRTENTAYIAVSGVFGIVGTSGFEPLTSCLSSRRSKPTELCSLHEKAACIAVSGCFRLVEAEGFEPPTLCL